MFQHVTEQALSLGDWRALRMSWWLLRHIIKSQYRTIGTP